VPSRRLRERKRTVEGTLARTILLVDDEPNLVDVLERYLLEDGFAVLRAADGPSAVELAEREQPDLIVLDLGLPVLSGTDVLRRVRAKRDVPIIILTARGEEVDRVVGLELGADDYVAKPFSPREVVARIRTVLRRLERAAATPPAQRPLRKVGRITLDPLGHEVTVEGKPVMLTPTQFKLLDVLVEHVGQTLTREQLIERVSVDGDVYDRTLDRHVANLRSRIEADPARPKYIVTVFGIGYKMVDPT
jgi:DNA-binding response OmpR family regulator